MKFNDAVCPHCSHRMSWQDAFQACAGYTGDNSVQPQPQANAQQAPQHLQALLDRAERRFQRKDVDAAISILNDVIRDWPTEAGAYHNRGLCYAAKGDFDCAIGDIREAIRLDPSERGFHETLADLEQFKRKGKPGFWGTVANVFMGACELQQALSKGTKTCTYCMRDIDLAASVCPYCTRDCRRPPRF